MDAEAWKRIIQVCKDHRLNHMRFHSWCPPKAAFEAADELGFYFQVECSTWSNQGVSLGRGLPIDAWSYEEADRILEAYGNHPSFLMFAQGNEPAGRNGGGVYLKDWVARYKVKDPRHLVTAASGWPQIAESDFHVTPEPRIQQWGAGLRSRINAKPSETMADYRDYVAQYPSQPVVAHEIGQWCVYPNFDEVHKYTGILKPKNFELFRDLLAEKHMLDQAGDFLMASGKLQSLCYKEEIESALRTPGFGGFQLLDLHDFPGQGTALVGVLDPFWDSKPYITSGEFRRFCAATVPLARLPKRTYTTNETLQAELDVAHFGPVNLEDPRVTWRIETEQGEVVGAGGFSPGPLLTGQLSPAGKIVAALNDVDAPARLRLVAEVAGIGAENDWDLWVYPQAVNSSAPEGIHITRRLDESAREVLRNGGKVLLLVPPENVKTDVVLGFSSIFWNTAWTGGQAPHTLGVLCDPNHPAFAAFPTAYHSDWQWWDIVNRAATLEMDNLHPELRPIIQIVPDWFEPKRLGLAFEALLEDGKLMICSIDLAGDLTASPVAQQLRQSLLAYMADKAFAPSHKLTFDGIQKLLTNPSGLKRFAPNARF